MVGLATSHFSQSLRVLQLHVELITLLLCASILPVRAVRVRKRALLVVLQLLKKSLVRIQVCEQALGFLRPEDGTMLHASTGKTLDLAKVYALVLQTLENKVHGFKPHCCWGVDLALAWVGQDTFRDAVFGAEIGVEVYLRLVLVLQVGVDDDA